MKALFGLTVSAAMLSLSSGCFAAAQVDQARTPDVAKQSAIMVAQAAGSSGGPAVTEPGEKTIGAPRKTETVDPAPANSGGTDTTGKADGVDASQSKRKDTAEPAQSGAK